MRRGIALLGVLWLVPLASASGTSRPVEPGMVRISGGSFRPLYSHPAQRLAQVAPFAIDTVPISSTDFLQFVARNPGWARGKVPAAFADAKYLEQVVAERTRAITQVSWFAAAAYCKARGARLPTTNEWEFLARASETDRAADREASFKQRVLDLALAADPGRYRIGSGFRNVWGVRDLHGGVFEWTSDYQSLSGDPDGQAGGHDGAASCATGVVQTGDASDYAAFLRYATRNSTDSRSTAGNIGFRCASSL